MVEDPPRGHDRGSSGRIHRHRPALEGPHRTASRRTRRAVPAPDHGTRRRRRPRLVPQPGRAFTKAGDSCTPAGSDVVVEVVAGTTRHAVVTVVRLH
jgi:hypothetical protein